MANVGAQDRHKTVLTPGQLPLAKGCGLTTDRQELTPAPIRIDVRRGVKALLLTLVIPMAMAVTADLTTGTLPWLTLAAVLICIPLATVVVSRTVLAEFNRVVDLVAPAEPEPSVEPELPDEPELSNIPEADSISNDWSLAGHSLTEGAQKHHG
jgi:hypothetical protein